MVMAVQAARSQAKAGLIKWLLFTALGGAIFLGVQVYEYRHLIGEDGMGMGKSLFDATFFGLTGFPWLACFQRSYLFAYRRYCHEARTKRTFGKWLGNDDHAACCDRIAAVFMVRTA